MAGRTVLTLAAASLAAASSASVFSSDAEAAYSALQQWYNTSNGLWVPSTGWWNSANCLTVIADLASIDDRVRELSAPVFPNTWVQAQRYNLQMTKTVQAPLFHMQTYYAHQWPQIPSWLPTPPADIPTGFLNGYYDDQGWWALAWIAAYDLTHNPQYLQTAESIFANMAEAWGTTPCNGGIWWDKAHTYVNAIANELFISVAAHLANRVPPFASSPSSPSYLDWAQRGWTWFQASGMINFNHTINDGLTASCTNNNGTVWSYNQGVILGALAELSRATGSSYNSKTYLTQAQTIADAAIAALTDSNGILHDVCEPDCGADGSQFKGVFARNLQRLHHASPQTRYAEFLTTNAKAIWASDRNAENQLSTVWSGPFVSPANASTQSSAMDALVGALAVSLHW